VNIGIITRRSDGSVALDFAPGGPFVVLTAALWQQLVQAVREESW
jgi:hypothetical protein